MKRKILIASLIVLALVVVGGLFLKRTLSSRDGDFLIFYGNVDIRQADLGFRVFGRVSKLLVDEGDVVEPGQLLAQLDPKPYVDQLEEVEGRLAGEMAQLANADQLLVRREGLATLGSISEEDYFQTLHNQQRSSATVMENRAALKLANQSLEDTHLLAPNAGTVLTRVREEGSVLQPGEPVFVVALEEPVWVRAYVSEPDLGKVYPGMPATIQTDTPKLYRGHIGFISPTAEFTPKTVQTTSLRTDLVYRMRVIVDNPDEGLRQGMPVTVKVRRE